jgi:hypothetical protein
VIAKVKTCEGKSIMLMLRGFDPTKLLGGRDDVRNQETRFVNVYVKTGRMRSILCRKEHPQRVRKYAKYSFKICRSGDCTSSFSCNEKELICT